MEKYGLKEFEKFKIVVVKSNKAIKVVEGYSMAMATMWLYQQKYTYADLFNSNEKWMGRFKSKKDTFIPNWIEADEELTLKDLYQPA